MGYRHSINFCCDSCDTNYLITDDSMELPPGWIGMQIVVSDLEGHVQDNEREFFCHFCSQKCLTEYSSSNDMCKRLFLASQESNEPNMEDDNENN